MKKLLFTLILAFAAMGAKAQVTWNVRVGGSLGDYYDYGYVYSFFGAAIAAEANIPFKNASRTTFSPSILILSEPSTSIHFAAPLHIGYKVPIGDRALFFPKVGPMVGIDSQDIHPLVGPSAELAFEIKRFVVALNGYVGLIETAQMGLCLTMGYKF